MLTDGKGPERASMPATGRRRSVLLAVTAATLTGAIAYAAGAQDEQAARAVSSEAPAESKNFEAFSRSQVKQDKEGAGAFGGPGASVDDRTVRKLRVKKAVWAATGDRTCVGSISPAAPAFSTACVDSAVAATDGVWSLSRPAPDQAAAADSPEYTEITALLPDGVDSVTIAVRQGAPVTAEVEDNAFVVSVDSSPDSATWTNANGVQQTLDLSPGR